VLSNLVDNACKYSPDSTEVVISAEQEDDHVRFTVRDHGPGIPLEDRDTIFEAFRQAQNRPTSESRGAGLGLAIAQALIEAHDGRIWIEDVEGPGTVISFTLPIARG
jgi:two-component system, OmpR family, sensor histidine kinase VicK